MTNERFNQIREKIDIMQIEFGRRKLEVSRKTIRELLRTCDLLLEDLDATRMNLGMAKQIIRWKKEAWKHERARLGDEKK